MTLRLAIFDCDGTMVDSQGAIIAAMHEAADLNALLPPAPEQVRRVVGLPLKEAMEILFPMAGSQLIRSLEDGYKTAFAAARARGDVAEPLYPGVVECLRGLEKVGYLLGVATGKSHRGLVATLKGHQLIHHFSTLQTADHAPGKPRPDMILQGLAETGVEAHHAVMIGDTTFDILMARNAGIKSIGVAWGYHHQDELFKAGADRVVEHGDDLVDTVQTILA